MSSLTFFWSLVSGVKRGVTITSCGYHTPVCWSQEWHRRRPCDIFFSFKNFFFRVEFDIRLGFPNSHSALLTPSYNRSCSISNQSWSAQWVLFQNHNSVTRPPFFTVRIMLKTKLITTNFDWPLYARGVAVTNLSVACKHAVLFSAQQVTPTLNR